MALESKPLFHPEVLRQQVRAFNLPERVADWQPKLQEWASLVTSGRADDFKESALLPDFLTDIFCGLLGYTGPVGPADTYNSHNSHNSHLSTTGPAASANTYTFSRERHVEVDGKVADAVLGRFQKGKEQFVAVLEGKGARDPWITRSPGGACRPWTRPISTPSICPATGSSSLRCGKRASIIKARLRTPTSALRPSDWQAIPRFSNALSSSTG